MVFLWIQGIYRPWWVDMVGLDLKGELQPPRSSFSIFGPKVHFHFLLLLSLFGGPAAPVAFAFAARAALQRAAESRGNPRLVLFRRANTPRMAGG